MEITNNFNLALPLQLFMVHSDYDHIDKENYISATGLIKPIKAIVLNLQGNVTGSNDVLDSLASSVGTASHDRLEKAFLNGNHIINMRKLGYDEDTISRIKINPTEVQETDIPIYLEKRTIKKLGKYLIGGKFDICLEGTVRDLKTTKVFSYTKHDFSAYKLQMSIYKWLNPDIIKKPYGYIDFIFTDWKAFETEKKGYPQTPALSERITLFTSEEVETWLSNKLNQIESLRNATQDMLPKCTHEELWQEANKWAFYAKPDSKRATKVSEDEAEINQLFISKGSKGRVEHRQGKIKRCNYCVGPDNCKQAQEYVVQGLL